MRKIVAMISLMTFVPAWADQAQDVQTFITFEEWQEIASSTEDNDDLIVFKDGKRMHAALTRLPLITYNFTQVEFGVDEVKTIAVVNQPDAVRLQYITREGQNYIGKLTQGKFVFWVNAPTQTDPRHMVEKELDPKLVNFIVLAHREVKSTYTVPHLCSLELKNGDHLPIAIMSNPILLSDGWMEKKIKPEQVLELCFDGVVHGKLIDKGIIENLKSMYVKDPHVMIQIPRTQFLINLPWTQISYIQGYNGGFRQPNGTREFLEPTQFDTIRTHIDSNLLTAYQNVMPGHIGAAKGTLLTGALCSHAVTSKAITELESLGNENMTALDALFDPEESVENNEEIALQDLEVGATIIQEVSASVAVNEDRMVLDNEFEILDDLTDTDETDWLANISFEAPDLNIDIKAMALNDIIETPVPLLDKPINDEIYLNLDEEESEKDILWTDRGDHETPLSSAEVAFIEEFLTGETHSVVWKKTQHLR